MCISSKGLKISVILHFSEFLSTKFDRLVGQCSVLEKTFMLERNVLECPVFQSNTDSYCMHITDGVNIYLYILYMCVGL